MENPDPYREQDLKHLQLFIYLIPVVGFFPALWTVYRHQGSHEQQRVSRLSITLALSWLLAYSLLATGTIQTSGYLTLRLLFINSLLTTGYFLVCLSLMIRLWQRQPLRLPFVSQMAEGFVRRHLS